MYGHIYLLPCAMLTFATCHNVETTEYGRKYLGLSGHAGYRLCCDTGVSNSAQLLGVSGITAYRVGVVCAVGDS